MGILCDMICELFSGGSFSDSRSATYDQNLDIYEKNPLAFTIVESRVDGNVIPVGISAILPLTPSGESAYCRNGGLRDAELRGYHVCAPGEWSSALVIFIVGFRRSARGCLRDRPWTRTVTVLFDHCAMILDDMRSGHPEKRYVRLLAQTDRLNGGMNKLLQRGTVDTGIITGDGYPLRELTVAVPDVIPDRHTLHGTKLDWFTRISGARSSIDIGRDCFEPAQESGRPESPWESPLIR